MRVEHQIRPRFPVLTETNDQFRIDGVIGAIDLGHDTVVEVSPKVDATTDWISATLDLLVGSDRVDAAGERAAGLSPERRTLVEVLAAIYAARLERALRRDGPILLLQRQHSVGAVLRGKLDASRWTSKALWQPHRFPVSFNALTADNDFSKAMALVAKYLSEISQSIETKGRLRQAARALRPGLPELASDYKLGPLDRQRSWRAVYAPAWSIAVALLSRRSLFRSQGQHHGISIAIEVWPLLERLLERSLTAACILAGTEQGRTLSSAPKEKFQILSDPTGSATAPRKVEPDGRLVEAGRTLATFEAKYKSRGSPWPDRADLYQALTTAAACDSPIAVLAYPEAFPSAGWQVVHMNGHPARLVAIGLDLFSYRSGSGDTMRARVLLEQIAGLTSPASSRTSMSAAGIP